MKTILSLTTVAAFIAGPLHAQPNQPPAPTKPLPPPPAGFGLRIPGLPLDGIIHEFKSETTRAAYLGVSADRAPSALAAQLGLPKGFGLVVEEVIPNSPAATAGIRQHDVLKLLNDQQLVEPSQLSTLVRAHGKDTQVTLTIVREGKEQRLTATLAEREFRTPFTILDSLRPPGMDEIRRHLPPLKRKIEEGARHFEKSTREFEERVRSFSEDLKEWAKSPNNSAPPKAPTPPQPPVDIHLDLLKEVRPGGAPEVKVIQDGNVTTWNTAEARVSLRDNDGEIEVATVDGKRTVTAKDPQGKVTFTGPIETDEQRRAMPAEVRKKLEQIQLQTDLEAEESPETSERLPASDDVQ